MDRYDNAHIVLLHHPVYNKRGDVVTTAVTNLDLHDIARIGKTYGAKHFYIVTPLDVQRKFVDRILSHWREGYGAEYNPQRKDAFDIVAVRSSLGKVCNEIEINGTGKVRVVATSAAVSEKATTFRSLRSIMQREGGDTILLFGTGWGLAKEVLDQADFILEPIKGTTSYNHLSVRSAVAITMDRLFGIRDR